MCVLHEAAACMQHPHSDGYLTTPPSPSLPLYLVGFSCLALPIFWAIYWDLLPLCPMPGSEVGVGLSDMC